MTAEINSSNKKTYAKLEIQFIRYKHCLKQFIIIPQEQHKQANVLIFEFTNADR